jgi:hypothetical protein
MKGTHIVKGATTAKKKRGKTFPLFKVQVWNWFSLNISFCCGEFVRFLGGRGEITLE